jgi:propanediol utilization protein
MALSPGPDLAFDRTLIESMVRQSLFQNLGRPAPTGQPPLLVVNSSARHMHVTQEHLEILFGPGHQLKVHKWLYQEGYFAAEEMVTLIGPRKRIIPNLRILGPCRNLTQIELAFTDAVQLGLDIPTRLSGDIKDTPGAYVMGPAGMLELNSGVIRAARHVHMGPGDLEFYGVKNGDSMKLRVVSPANTVVFEDVVVRHDPKVRLEVHIDTDEANACALDRATKVELIR